MDKVSPSAFQPHTKRKEMMKMKYYTPEEIYYNDAGVVTLGCETLRFILAETLARIPSNIVDDVYDNCLFYMFEFKGGGYTTDGVFIPNEVIKDKHIIMYHTELPEFSEKARINLVLHEIAHYVLKHKTQLRHDNVDREKQEQEADDLVNKWLKQAPRYIKPLPEEVYYSTIELKKGD